MMMNSDEWWKKSVVYQIYPKSFNDTNGDGIGDLNGITEKLDYLQKLGVDVLWLNPIYESPGIDNGYDISNYYGINPEFGSMDDFERLLSSAHRKGIKIILDLVVNHTSSQHPWFKEAVKSRDNKYHDYYIWKPGRNGGAPNNWGSSFGGSAWKYVESVGEYYLHLFAEEQPDLNWENPAVVEEVEKIMDFWLSKGVDGFRMDVINLISKYPGYKDGPKKKGVQYGDYYDGVANGPHVHEYIKKLNSDVLSKYDTMTVGETPHTTPNEAAQYVKSDAHELNMVFQFDHMHLDYGKYGRYSGNRYNVKDLKRVMTKWQYVLDQNSGWNSLYWSNHDQPRAVSRFGNEKYRVASAKCLGVLLHMQKGTPFIYQGEEIGMVNAKFNDISDYNDVDAKNAYHVLLSNGESKQEALKILQMKSRDNARTPMQWNASENSGFTPGKPWLQLNKNYTSINVDKDLHSKDSVFQFYQQLIRLRHELDVITVGKYQLIDTDDDIFAFERISSTERLVVVGNLSTRKGVFEKHNLEKYTPLLHNYDNVLLNSERLVLRPFEALIFYKKVK